MLNSAISACEKGAAWSQAFVAGKKTTGDLTFRDFLMDTRDPYILATLHVSPPVVGTVSTLTTGHGVAEEFPSTPAVGRCILALDLGENLWGLTNDVIPFHLWPFVFLVCIDAYCVCSPEGKHGRWGRIMLYYTVI